MLFSGKENVFICLVAFQKIIRKIFFGVRKRRRKRPKNIFWCLEKKKEKTNPEKHRQNPKKTQKKNHQRLTLDWVRRHGASRVPIRDRDRRRDLAKARRSRLTSWDCDRWRDLAKRRLRSRKAPRRSQSAQCFARSARTGGSSAIIGLD